MTAKQEAFVAEYLVDLNATQAAIRAGYSQKTARAIGHELLGNDQVAATIAARQADVAAKLGITHEKITSGLLGIAEQGESETARVRAWELLGKHVGFFPKETAVQEHTGGVEVTLAFNPGRPE